MMEFTLWLLDVIGLATCIFILRRLLWKEIGR